jgi:hypothetical protein
MPDYPHNGETNLFSQCLALFRGLEKSVQNKNVIPCLYPLRLDAFYRLFGAGRGKEWIPSPSLPGATPFRSTHHIHHWAQSYVDAFAPELCAHSCTSLIHKVAIEGCRSVDCGWESTILCGKTNAERTNYLNVNDVTL